MQSRIAYIVAFLGIILLAFGCEKVEEGRWIGGVQIHEPDLENWASTIKKSGMNTVEVTVYARNGDWNSQWMKFEDEEPYVLEEIRAAKREGLKVVLILRQALDHYYPANKFLWHGMIYPVTEPELAVWFQTYEDFVDKWAETAEREKVDALVIGSELNALAATLPTDSIPETIAWFGDSVKFGHWERRVLRYREALKQKDLWVRGFPNYETPEAYLQEKVRAHYQWAVQVGFGLDSTSLPQINARRQLLDTRWRQVIRKARTHYAGPLSFAANFDNYHEIAFWDELDFIGVNAYFPLREPLPREEQAMLSAEGFRAGWLRVLADIDTFRVRQNLSDKPVFFTELGYTYRENSTLCPWQADGFSVVGRGDAERLIVWPDRPIDYRERTLAVEGLYEAVLETDFPLMGILYWKLSSVPELLEIEPFGLHIAPHPTDSLQTALTRFLDLPPLEAEE